VAGALRELHADPTPFEKALARYPSTLVHGDPKRENVGLIDSPTRGIVLIDWQFASAQPPAVDLAWYGPSTVPHDRVIDQYQARLAHRLGALFEDSEWEPQLRLALLGQCIRQMGAQVDMAYNHQNPIVRDMFRANLPWWCHQARAGLKWL
jgi:thiamine kinase-like enzyme